MTTDTTEPRDLTGYRLNAYVALDTIEEIHRRVENLLRGREFTVVRRYVTNGPTFPEVKTGLRLDTEVFNGVGAGIRFGTATQNPWGSIGIYATPGITMVGIGTGFATEAEAKAVDHADEHRLRNCETTHVTIQGGTAPENVGRESLIEILRTNEFGVSESIVIAPRVVESHERAEAEGVFFDRLAAYCDRTGIAVGPAQARALAVKVRYDWASPLDPKEEG